MMDQIQLFQSMLLGMAAGSLYVGVRGLKRKRSVLWPSRSLFAVPFWAVVVLFVANMAARRVNAASANISVHFLHVAMTAGAYGMLSWKPEGYVMLGVTPASVRRAVQYALGKLGLSLSHEDRGSTFFVRMEGFELEISVQSLIGTAMIRASKGDGGHRLAAIVAHMKDYLSCTELETNRTVFGYCVGVGASALAVAVALLL